MRDEEQWHHHGGNEVSGTQLTWLEPDTNKTLIKCVQKIRSSPKIEHPDQQNPKPALKTHQCEQGQDCGNQITICGRTGESPRQICPDDAGHQECQANKPETVQEEDRPEGSGPRLAAESWPKICGHDNAPGNEAEGNARSEESLRRDHGSETEDRSWCLTPWPTICRVTRTELKNSWNLRSKTYSDSIPTVGGAEGGDRDFYRLS